MKITTKKTEVSCLSRNAKQCALDVSDITLQQVEKFKYLGGYARVTKGGTKAINSRFGKANALLRELHLWSQNGSIPNSKAVRFKIGLCSDPPCGHESWVITEIIPFQVQKAEMGFLRNVCSVTLREKVWSCEIRKTVNDPSYVSSAMWREYPRKDWRGKSCRLHPWESGSEVV